MKQLNAHWLAGSKITTKPKPLVKFVRKTTKRYFHKTQAEWLKYSQISGTDAQQSATAAKLSKFVRGATSGVSVELWIYSVADMPGLNGFATLPQTVRDYKLAYDGVFMCVRVFPSSALRTTAFWPPNLSIHWTDT